MKSALQLMLLALSLIGFQTSAAEVRAGADDSMRFDFDVFLDDRKIGTHLFEVEYENGVRKVESTADFKYTVLFIPAYRYQHRNSEYWNGDCLARIEAQTNANGKRIKVSGEKTGSGFLLEDDTRPELPKCVMSFAYWNPEMLEQSQLLNPQTGEYLDVDIEEVGSETIDVRGEATKARRYELKSSEARVSLWYTDLNEWVGLESVARGGRIIRYVL